MKFCAVCEKEKEEDLERDIYFPGEYPNLCKFCFWEIIQHRIKLNDKKNEHLRKKNEELQENIFNSDIRILDHSRAISEAMLNTTGFCCICEHVYLDVMEVVKRKPRVLGSKYFPFHKHSKKIICCDKCYKEKFDNEN